MAERNDFYYQLRYFTPNGGMIRGPRHWRTGLINFVPLEEVGILQFPSSPFVFPSFPYEGGVYHEDAIIQDSPGRQFADDFMSYEELLALEEQVGNVSTGVAEHNISKCLKIKRTHNSGISSSRTELETPICVICQDEYKDNEKLGGLRCGHEYHNNCIKQWLLIKNECPICKRPAFST